jgi:hypothetical protein
VPGTSVKNNTALFVASGPSCPLLVLGLVSVFAVYASLVRNSSHVAACTCLIPDNWIASSLAKHQACLVALATCTLM